MSATDTQPLTPASTWQRDLALIVDTMREMSRQTDPQAMVRTYAAENESTRVRAMLLNPGPLRTSMRAAAMPGEDPATLKTPEELAPHFVRLASPAWNETGKLYDFPTDRMMTFQGPA